MRAIGRALLRTWRRFIRFVGRLIGLTIGGAVGAAAIGGCLALLIGALPSVGRAAEFTPPDLGNFERLNERSIVLDRNGVQLAVFRSAENRKTVPLAKVPKHLVQAILDVEDADFYRHKGVNLRATSRAMLSNLAAGGIEQGGSTITQQLIKTDLLSRRQQFDRKIREARLAVELEKKRSKDWILTRYLNTVYFGGGAYGVEAAANHYFGLSVDKLDPGQSAFLAGMIRNPVGYDPVRFRARSRDRRSTVLARLVATGHMTKAQADLYDKSPMPRPLPTADDAPNSYFVEAVKQSLLDDPRLGDTAAERYQSLFNGGLRITTTYDPTMQAEAEQAVKDTLPENATEFTAALVSLDTTSGAVRAMVGGRGFDTDKFDLVTQARRQPGSSWKPFTLIAALEAGNSPRSVISGTEPCPIPNPGGDPDPYLPNNSSEGSGAVTSLVDQLVFSSNCAYARLASIIGLDSVIGVAKRLGITTKLDAVPAMALGTEEVKPIEMAAAYATIADDGRYHEPYFVEKVERVSGKSVKLLFKGEARPRQVLRPQIARMAQQAMREVVRRGTGTKARLGDRQVAGKTGTAQNYEDAWFVGFTAQRATAVWMGAPVGKIPMKNVGGIRVTGGSYPAMIWHQFMEEATKDDVLLDFTDPDPDEMGKATCLQLKAPAGAKFSGSKSSSKSGSKSSSNSKKKRSTATTVASAGGRGFSIAGTVQQIISAQTSSGNGTSGDSATVTSAKKKKKKTSSGCDSWGATATVKKTTRKTTSTTVRRTSEADSGSGGPVEVANPTPAVVEPAPEQTPAPAPEVTAAPTG